MVDLELRAYHRWILIKCRSAVSLFFFFFFFTLKRRDEVLSHAAWDLRRLLIVERIILATSAFQLFVCCAYLISCMHTSRLRYTVTSPSTLDSADNTVDAVIPQLVCRLLADEHGRICEVGGLSQCSNFVLKLATYFTWTRVVITTKKRFLVGGSFLVTYSRSLLLATVAEIWNSLPTSVVGAVSISLT